MTLISAIGLVVFVAGEKQASEDNYWVTHTHEVIATTANFEKQLVDAETGQRGFLLTDSPTYLEPYYTGRRGATEKLNRLKFLTRDNDAQQQRLETIQGLMQQKFAELQETIDLTTSGKKDLALALVKTDEGKQLMDDMRPILYDFTEEELRLLQERQERFKTTTFTAQIWYVSAFIIVIVVLVLGFIGINTKVVIPLTDLAKLALRIGEGEKAEFPKHSEIEEIDRLIRSFEYMAEEIESRSMALVAQQEQLQSRVDRQTLELIQSEKMSSLGQLVAGVAHEINNPVNFIHGNIPPLAENTQNLLDLIQLYQATYPTTSVEIEEKIEDIDLDFLKQDSLKILTSMTVGTKRIRQIVSSLKNFSRLDESEYKEADIHEGLDSTFLLLEHRIKATSERPRIQIEKDYGDLPLVNCFPGQLNQVFMNILANALDALEERDRDRSLEAIDQNPSTIKIQTQRVGSDRVMICIEDNGPGIPETIRQQIFDPFFTTKPIGKGTGLGMSISYKIITEKHDGTFHCQSSAAEGTRFIIDIPFDLKRSSER
ncbi:CHASE3 domain-containing protein [Roseofilum casamattae]|uniref:histidine kinase n=1 Tax=Roseofilum casamattae BLCC-M143 TaxID=3022442 RepID=A0ABT7BTM9_9CYAN|nr:CHASE3 domain-containing protein [Roseofilum casamattae]MDJ1181658.1 CHASE3 domain-containing protein [Roseofilum casamattae BLCC-M143]